MYIYGGYLITGGTLDDGKPWQGINLLLGKLFSADDVPRKGVIGKMRYTDANLAMLRSLAIGQPVDVAADVDDGKIIYIAPASSDGIFAGLTASPSSAARSSSTAMYAKTKDK